jgi:hypothetical protein
MCNRISRIASTGDPSLEIGKIANILSVFAHPVKEINPGQDHGGKPPSEQF